MSKLRVSRRALHKPERDVAQHVATHFQGCTTHHTSQPHHKRPSLHMITAAIDEIHRTVPRVLTAHPQMRNRGC